MPCAISGNISFSVAIVVADTSQMAKQLARGDWRLFLRKCRTIFLDGSVEVQFAVLPKLQNGSGGDRLGNGPKTKKGGRGHRSKNFPNPPAESRRPDRPTPPEHCPSHSR